LVNEHSSYIMNEMWTFLTQPAPIWNQNQHKQQGKINFTLLNSGFWQLKHKVQSNHTTAARRKAITFHDQCKVTADKLTTFWWCS